MDESKWSRWEYRVVERKFREHTEDRTELGLYEVYFDDKDLIIGIAANMNSPLGENIEDLKTDIGNMMEGLNKPVLDYGQITEQIAKAKS